MAKLRKMREAEQEDANKHHRVKTPESLSGSFSDSNLSPSEKKWKKYQK